MKQIFIAGPSRTGSKFYMQLLNTHEDIFISPELIFRHPVKKDFYGLLRKKIEQNATLDDLINSLFLFKERLPYVKTIKSIGKKKLRDEIENIKVITPYKIFDLIIKEAAKVRNKKIYGAKFSLHFSYTDELAAQFPESKIIYLTRDPRAIFISDLRKKKKESKGPHYRFPIKGTFLRVVMLFYIMKEWYSSIKYYEKCTRSIGSDRISLFHYEKINMNDDKVVQNIAKYLGFKKNDFKLSSVKIVDSSYEEGVSNSRWQSEIYGIENLIFKLILGKKMKKYGYD